MKKLAVFIFVLSLTILFGCGKGNGNKNDQNLTTEVLPVMLEKSVSLTHILVFSMSLTQRMLQRVDAVNIASTAGTESETCLNGGRVDYAFTSGAYPVTVTFNQCADERSTISGKLRFDTYEGNRDIEFLSDLNITHDGSETIMHSGTKLCVSASANNSANQDINLSFDMKSKGLSVKSDHLTFVNLYLDGKSFVMYDGNISIDQNVTFTYNFPSCGGSGAVCVPSPTQVYILDNGILTAGEGGEPLYFISDNGYGVRMLIEENNSLEVATYDANNSLVGSERIDVSGSLF